MILYMDYFEDEKMVLPYETKEEYLEELMALLDMLLDRYLEKKGGAPEGKWFSRGLVVTESEMKDYLNKPPFLRKKDQVDLFLKSQMDSAKEHIEERIRRTKESTKLPFAEIIKRFELTNYEALGVLLSLVVELDLKYARIFAYLQDDISAKLPTAGLLEALYNQCEEKNIMHVAELLDENGKMATYFFNFLGKKGESHLTRSLSLNTDMRDYLLGRMQMTSWGNGLLITADSERNREPFWMEEALRIGKIENKEKDTVQYIYLEGNDDTAKRLILEHIAGNKGKKLLILDMKALEDTDRDKVTKVIRHILFEVKLYDGMIYIEHCTRDIFEGVKGSFMRYLFKRELKGQNVYLAGDDLSDVQGMEEQIQVMEVKAPGVHTRLAMWEYFMEGEILSENISLAELADSYEISYGAIQSIARASIGKTRGLDKTVLEKELLYQEVFRRNRVQFGHLASKVNAVYTWDDIQMQDSQKKLLKIACNRYKMKNRLAEDWELNKKNAYGNGVSVLLYGPPGTGKTMAAQVIANEVGLELYRIDLSQIFSKYIGETEKNLGMIFDKAQNANVILFFDEADALFAKRTDVNSSNDKHSNSETAYLLQKIEEYRGISILATNLYHNFDSAFVRRITYAVRLDNPDEETRYTLWTTMLPKEVPVSEFIDFHFLAAKFELSGSNIKSILYSAAYMAAAEQRMLSEDHIVYAMKYEFEKLGRMVQKADFGKYAIYLYEDI